MPNKTYGPCEALKDVRRVRPLFAASEQYRAEPSRNTTENFHGFAHNIDGEAGRDEYVEAWGTEDLVDLLRKGANI